VGEVFAPNRDEELNVCTNGPLREEPLQAVVNTHLDRVSCAGGHDLPLRDFPVCTGKGFDAARVERQRVALVLAWTILYLEFS
jgi:hypothetical protein